MSKSHPARQRAARIIKIGKGDKQWINGRGTCHVLRSYAVVGAILGLSRQRVQQIERIALYKLRLGLLPHIKEINPELYEELLRTLGIPPEAQDWNGNDSPP